MSRLIACSALGAAILLLEPGGVALAQSPSGSAPHTTLAPAPVHHARGHRHRVSWHRPGIAPLPAAPVTRSAGNTSPAPVPNEAVSPPDQPAPEAQIAPKSFQLHYPPVGDGYVTGSSSQAMDDREAAKATGVEMSVPLK